MSRAPVGVGVVGAGFMGAAFAQICAEVAETRLVGVADPNAEAGEPAAKRFGVPLYRDAGDLIARPEADAIIVATPEDAHVGPCLLALGRGKAVLVEKPIADTAAHARTVADAAERSGAVLLVGHILRFHPHYVLAKQAVDDGRIGVVRHLYTRRLNSVRAQERLRGRCSLPLFLGVHDYDVVRWFAASDPARVYAESQRGVLEGLGYATEDANWALITFANGILAACETGWILPRGHSSGSDTRLAVQGSEGRLDVELMDQGIALSGPDRSAHLDTLFLPRVRGELRSIFVDEVRHFARCATGEARPLVTARDAVAAVVMAEAVLESARTHEPVTIAAGAL
jgi:predicted dehydrogenase